MSIHFRLYLFLLLVSFSTTILGFAPPTPKSMEAVRAQYQLLESLHEEQAISTEVFQQKTQALQKIAKEQFDLDITGMQIEQVVPAQRINWLATALYGISALLLLLFATLLFRQIQKPLLKWIRAMLKRIVESELFQLTVRYTVAFVKASWEILSYFILASLLWQFPHEYSLLAVSTLGAGLISYSYFTRVSTTQVEQKPILLSVHSCLLLLLWGGLGFWSQHYWLGFLMTAALIYLFATISYFLFPKQERWLFSLTAFNGLATLGVLAWAVYGNGASFQQLQAGALFLMPLAYLGNLIVIIFYIRTKHKRWPILLELLFVASLVILLAAGIRLELNHLSWIALGFLTLYLLFRYFTLVLKKVNPIWGLLLSAGILGGVGYLLKTHLTTVMAWLSFL